MAFRAPDGANDNDNDNNCQGNNGGRVLFLVQQAYRWTIVTFFIKKKTVSDKIFYLSVEANEKLPTKTTMYKKRKSNTKEGGVDLQHIFPIRRRKKL